MASPFPPGVDFIPVPAPLLGDLLAEISDIAELKVTLRALWHIHQKKGAPRPLRPAELFADRALAAALGEHGTALEHTIERSLDAALEHGVFLRFNAGDDRAVYVLNTAPEQRAAARRFPAVLSTDRHSDPPPESTDAGVDSVAETWSADTVRPNVFVLYEENIGSLTPLVAERMREAQSSYPEAWIADAIATAAERNARNWKYIAAVLERWRLEGRGDGESRRDSQKTGLDAYRRSYGRYVRRT